MLAFLTRRVSRCFFNLQSADHTANVVQQFRGPQLMLHNLIFFSCDHMDVLHHETFACG